MKPYCSAIIPAAGNSTRMAMGQSKQFLPLLGKPAIVYTLQAFEQAKSVDEIILVCRDEDKEQLNTCVHMAGITKPVIFTLGGTSRQQSVFSGVRACASQTEYIIIHDGARPLVKTEQIAQVIQDASVFGGATLGVPVKDTIKVVNDRLIVDTPYRPHLYITQTPQVFKRQLYFEAVTFAEEHALDFTDDCQLIEAINCKVYMTEGDYTNIKITTPEDIAIAEILLARQKEEA